MCRPHVSIDLRAPFLACTNATVMPINNQTRAAEQGKLLFELVAQRFVFMRGRVGPRNFTASLSQNRT